ncbi:MAG: nucleotidyltransferase domain-containing protein [Deltaproteobacteria bacterium]|nr:nucleotidyltransferase domain-containing protein [Deltaproteobacteria bacterium]
MVGRIAGKDDNVIFALIFGSFSKGRPKGDSDLDMAIFFKTPLEGLDLLFYRSRLSELTGKEVDLTVLNRASAFLRHQVMKYGHALLIKDRSIYSRFREKTIYDYGVYKKHLQDFKKFSEIIRAFLNPIT